MARESVHKPRPTSELASPQLKGGKRRLESDCSLVSDITDDSDQTVRPINEIQQKERSSSMTTVENRPTSVSSLRYESHTESPFLRLSLQSIEVPHNLSLEHEIRRSIGQEAQQEAQRQQDDEILLFLLESHDQPKQQHDFSVLSSPKTDKMKKEDGQQLAIVNRVSDNFLYFYISLA